MTRTLLVAPAGRAAGLTTATLGLVRALDRQGARVAFAKPISTRGGPQPRPGEARFEPAAP
jgi:phosphate acetyltransferase